MGAVLLRLLVIAFCLVAVRSASARPASDVAPIDRAFAKVVGRGAPGAVVLVLRHGQVIARRAYGLANVELETPMKVDDRFRIASISK
jgi:CubicO group peptidase (beta-lactamase class C family)